MSNNPEAIKNFPEPFNSDSYMYSVNIQPVTDEALFDVDEHYYAEIEERDRDAIAIIYLTDLAHHNEK